MANFCCSRKQKVEVSLVELINNGLLNKRYEDKKTQFTYLQKNVGEEFVFHGTTSTKAYN